MTIYKQIDHIINLILSTKKIIILILIIVNGLGFVYYKNLKKTYLADIIVTAIPNEIRPNAVDIFNIYEIYFRDPKNLDNWIKIRKKQNGNKDVLINRDEILGYNITESQLNIYNKVFFRNAVTLQRSIYLTVPGEDLLVLRNIFLYALYIEKLLNLEANLLERNKKKVELKSDKKVFNIYEVLSNLKINFDFDLEKMNDQKMLLDKYFLFIDELTKELEELNIDIDKDNYIDKDKDKDKDLDNIRTRSLDFVRVAPPKKIYTNSINPNKIYFSTTFLSIFLICIILIYTDFMKSKRKSLKLDK